MRLHLETDASLNPTQRKLVDGAQLKRAGGGIVVRSLAMDPLGLYEVPLGFLASVTQAEALTLLRGMRIARERHHASSLRARTDAHSLVQMVRGEARARDPALRTTIESIVLERDQFSGFDLRWSPSSHAYERQHGVPTADFLARKAAGLGSRL